MRFKNKSNGPLELYVFFDSLEMPLYTKILPFVFYCGSTGPVSRNGTGSRPCHRILHCVLYSDNHHESPNPDPRRYDTRAPTRPR